MFQRRCSAGWPQRGLALWYSLHWWTTGLGWSPGQVFFWWSLRWLGRSPWTRERKQRRSRLKSFIDRYLILFPELLWLIFFVLCSPEQQKETVDLQHDSNNWPANQHHKNAAKEETGGFHFVLLEEEAESPFEANDEGKSSNKQDLRAKKKN